MHEILTRIPATARPLSRAIMRSVLFAVLLMAAASAGEIPLPGTPVPITVQTLVVMLTGLMLPWHEAAASVVLYLGAGAAGLPVFAGGGSIGSFMGPSAGFLIGFLPAVIVTALVATPLRERTQAIRTPLMRWMAALTANLAAALIGCVGVLYILGIAVQSAVTAVPLSVVAASSASFIAVDMLKATVACITVTGLHAGMSAGRASVGATRATTGVPDDAALNDDVRNDAVRKDPSHDAVR